jgi:acetoacetyl-CoA synthetase
MRRLWEVDGVTNVRGMRVDPAAIYRVVREFEPICESMVVQQHSPAASSESRVVLLLVLREGVALDGVLTVALRRRLAATACIAYVPDLILQVFELPYTHSGEPAEAALTDAINGQPVRNLAALRNPDCLDAIRDAPALRMCEAPWIQQSPPPAPGWRSRRDTEVYLQSLWERMFGFSPIGLDHDFFELGGHSQLAASMLAEIQRTTSRGLTLTTLLEAPSIRKLAAVIDTAAWEMPIPLVQLRPGNGRPFFLVHSLSGTFLELWPMLRMLDTRRPVYGLQPRGLTPGQEPYLRVSDMAADYIGHMRSVQAHGPYAIGGYSFGGLVAFDIAQQLCRAGETVELLSLIDTHVHGRYLPLRQWLFHRVRRLGDTVRTLNSLPRQARLPYLQNKSAVLIDRVRARFGLTPRRPDLVGDVIREAHFPPALRRVRGAMLLAMRQYRPEPYPGKVVYLRAAVPGNNDPLPVWRKVVRGGLDVNVTPGDHDEMICGPNAKELALALGRHL